jgi:hypothetical protein
MPIKQYNLEVDNNGFSVPVTRIGQGTPLSATCSTSASSAESLAGHTMFRITSDNNVWLKFGGGSVAATADGTDSVLFLAGTEILIVPRGTTHWSGIRAGASDALVQLLPIND